MLATDEMVSALKKILRDDKTLLKFEENALSVAKKFDIKTFATVC
jgi:hypothetical protein